MVLLLFIVHRNFSEVIMPLIVFLGVGDTLRTPVVWPLGRWASDHRPPAYDQIMTGS